MTRIRSHWEQRPSKPYLPYHGHSSDSTMLLDDGSLLAMAEVHGKPHELSSDEDRSNQADLLERIWCDVGNDDLTMGVHLVRDRAITQKPQRRFRNAFSEQLHDALFEHYVKGKIFTNDWFLSTILSPSLVPIGTPQTRRKLNARIAKFKKSTAVDMVVQSAAVEDLWIRLGRSLSEYNMKRVGIIKHGRYDYRFSLIANAMRRFLGLPALYPGVPITTGRIGQQIYTDMDQAIFERRIFRVLPPGCDDESDDAEGVKWGAVFGLNTYMEQTHPDLFDALLSLPMPLVLSQMFGFMAKPDAVSFLRWKFRQMRSSNDPARNQRRGIRRAADRVASGKVRWGAHNCVLTIYADSYSELMHNAARARAALISTGAQIEHETLGNQTAYFSQLPGNWKWLMRSATISTRSFVDFANFGAFPRGFDRGIWGEFMLALKTTAGTVYKYIPHVEDVGHLIIFARTGRGKTVILCLLMAMYDQYMFGKGENGIIILFDAYQGCRIFFEFIGGNYLVIKAGEPSGLAPLLGYKEDTPYARDRLQRLFRACIESDGLGVISAIDDKRLARAIAAMLNLPLEKRSLAAMRMFMGWSPNGAGMRFERWCREYEGHPAGALWWLFDGPRDDISFEGAGSGFDFTTLLETAEIDLAAQYVRDRTGPIIETRRTAVVCDESQKIMTAETFERDIKNWLDTIRKLDGIVNLVAPRPEDLMGTKFGAAIVGQCATKIIGPTPNADDAVYCGVKGKTKGLGCTDGEFYAITTGMLPGSHKWLIKREGAITETESVIIDLDFRELPPWMMDVLSGRGETVRIQQELRAKSGDWRREFAEQRQMANA